VPPHNQNRIGLTLVLACLTGVILLLLHLVRSRLATNHANLFGKLGSPGFNDSNLGRPYWALQRFIWWGHLSEVRDTKLHILCILACMSELALGVSCFL
jgi:hypothetical protein